MWAKNQVKNLVALHVPVQIQDTGCQTAETLNYPRQFADYGFDSQSILTICKLQLADWDSESVYVTRENPGRHGAPEQNDIGQVTLQSGAHWNQGVIPKSKKLQRVSFQFRSGPQGQGHSNTHGQAEKPQLHTNPNPRQQASQIYENLIPAISSAL